MKNRILIAACVAAAAVLIFVLMRDSDERRIRAQLKRFRNVVTKSDEAVSEIVLLGNTRALQALLTDACTVRIGSPVPDMNGKRSIVAAYFHVMKMSLTIEVALYDISVTIGDDRATATSVMTATAGSPDGRGDGIEAREIEMRWKKIEDTWKIAEVKAAVVFR